MKHKKSDRIAHVFSRVPNIRSYVEDFFWKLPSTMIGLEIEMEGTLNPISELGSNYTILWEQKEDSSLRVVDEYNPFEIIFKVPLSGKDLSEAINQYEIGLQKLKTPPVWGERTSIHVHLDVRECTLKQLFNKLDKKLLEQVFLVHGDYDQQQALRESLNLLEITNISIPEKGEEIYC